MRPNTRFDDSEIARQIQSMKRDLQRLLKHKNFSGALQTIKDMVSCIDTVKENGDAGGAHIDMSAVVDESIQAFTALAFAQPFRGSSAGGRISHGLEAIHLQLSSSTLLAPPFNTMPRSTFVNALKALTGVITNNSGQYSFPGRSFQPIDAAFRILQRLVTGRGVRHQALNISERDFNMVLNAVCHIGRMDMAHKIVALQERTAHAPPLSPVAYSILLKGYGRLHDLQNVQMILSHAGMNGVKPDTVMLNSVIDAFVNCDDLETAHDIFHYMKDPGYKGRELSKYSSLLVSHATPPPNRRTFNTILKGLARKGETETAMKLSREMEKNRLWDDVTTNTLVSAAVKANDFDLAEGILANCTAVLDSKSKHMRHPNVEAYTELLDGYAKASNLDKALGILRLMFQRGVEPNEYTYTCIIAGLARAKKVDQAHKMLQFMESKNIQPRTVTYNAFISGLVAPAQPNSSPDHFQASDLARESESLAPYVSEAIKLLRRMMKAGVRPNSVTTSVLVNGLGRCDPPRLGEAKALVTKLRNDGIVVADDERIATAMVQTCGLGNDLNGALQNFRQMNKPDLVAVNAFLDACCRCDHVKLAFDTFGHFFGDRSNGNIAPDVITYSILITALLKIATPSAMQRTRELYTEMKRKRDIMPDKVLVDM
jgi:pentatricopeptide repeat protein